MQLSQKETTLLNDAKSHEELCIKKYANYADQAQDQQLKQIFTEHGKHELEHLNTINQLLSGQIPSMGQGQQQSQSQQAQSQYSSGGTGMLNQEDADLCQDMLSTEKYVSQTYDRIIFEFRDPNIRKILNHIQTEEQQHGEDLFRYMQSKGMYQVH